MNVLLRSLQLKLTVGICVYLIHQCLVVVECPDATFVVVTPHIVHSGFHQFLILTCLNEVRTVKDDDLTGACHETGGEACAFQMIDRLFFSIDDNLVSSVLNGSGIIVKRNTASGVSVGIDADFLAIG